MFKKVETAMVDYAKYNNMNARQLVNSLIALERKEKKYRAESSAKIKAMQDTIQYLQNRIQETFKKPKYDFTPLEKTGLAELAEEIKGNIGAEEYVRLKQEVKNEL